MTVVDAGPPAGASDWRAFDGAAADPVFVLCCGRSGSTLLRLLLDAHPDLACPPEARLPEVISRLAGLWSTMDTLPLSVDNGGQGLPPAAIAGVRHTTDLIVGPYLARRGKKRYCDKNLGAEFHADRLLEIFPDARFICLYRHPMDVIASGIEASPWGAANYGFEPYVARTPGNTVLALARYWADRATAILAVEDRHPHSCYRVRYEDLVEDPDTVTTGIFEFLGLPPVEGISARCFSGERERFGAGDFKIWNTSQITSESVGRGWTIPANLMKLVTPAVNELADRLGYVQVDDEWGAAARPADMRVSANGQAPDQASPALAAAGPVPPGSLLVSQQLQAGLHGVDEEFRREWKPYCDEPFLMIALAAASRDDAWWLVDLSARMAVTGSGNCTEEAAWLVSAPATAWAQVIRDGTNLGTAFRRSGMRYWDRGDAGPGSIIAEQRVAMMSNLLGLTTWTPGKWSVPAAARSQDRGNSSDTVMSDKTPPGPRQSPELPADLDADLWASPEPEAVPR